MPVQQEIVHWYNAVPNVSNEDIPNNSPTTPAEDMMAGVTDLRNLLDRLCDEIGTLSYEMENDVVEIREHGTVYSFNIREWLTNRRVVMAYLRDWFTSFRIHLEREVRRNATPNTATVPLNNKPTPSTCTGKEEASDVNYLDVI